MVLLCLDTTNAQHSANRSGSALHATWGSETFRHAFIVAGWDCSSPFDDWRRGGPGILRWITRLVGIVHSPSRLHFGGGDGGCLLHGTFAAVVLADHKQRRIGGPLLLLVSIPGGGGWGGMEHRSCLEG